jgi:hypothetical protein
MTPTTRTVTDGGALPSSSDAALSRALSTYGCLDAVNAAAPRIYQGDYRVLAECQVFSWSASSSNPVAVSAALEIPQTYRDQGVTLRITSSSSTYCSWYASVTASDFSASNDFNSSLAGSVSVSAFPRKVCVMMRCDSSTDNVCDGISYTKTFTPPKCTSYPYKTFSPDVATGGYSDKDDCVIASSRSTVSATLSIPQSSSSGYQGVELQVGFVAPSSDCVTGTYQKRVSTTSTASLTSLSISNLSPSVPTNLKLCLVVVCNTNSRYTSCKNLQLKLDYSANTAAAAAPTAETIAAGFVVLIVIVGVCVFAASGFFAHRRLVQQKPLWGASSTTIVVSSQQQQQMQPQPQPFPMTMMMPQQPGQPPVMMGQQPYGYAQQPYGYAAQRPMPAQYTAYPQQGYGYPPQPQ